MSFDPEALPVPDFGLRCRQCDYLLKGLMSHRCPECGQTFTLDEHIPPGDWPMLYVDGATIFATPGALAILEAAQVPIFPVSTDPPFGMARDYGATPRICVARTAYWEAVHAFAQYARGEPIEASGAQEIDWTCVNCGESNPGNFEICWQCNADRPGET